jgi:hypothetical protein
MPKTPYTEGFEAGMRYQRDHILDFVSVHLDQGVEITALDIVEEINHQDKKDMDTKIQEMGL